MAKKPATKKHDIVNFTGNTKENVIGIMQTINDMNNRLVHLSQATLEALGKNPKDYHLDQQNARLVSNKEI